MNNKANISVDEERPKLKARRFNKFEPSSSASETKDELLNSKTGLKRSGTEEGNYPCKSKRICIVPELNESPIKNLAQNRLNKLRRKLQQERTTNQNSPLISEEQTSNNTPINSTRTTQLESERLVENNFDNFRFNASVNQLRKNIANEGLQNINKKINYTKSNCNSTLSCSNSNQNKIQTRILPEHTRLKHEERRVTNLKRNTSSPNVTYNCNYDLSDDSPKYKRKNTAMSSLAVNTEKEDSILKEVKNVPSTDTCNGGGPSVTLQKNYISEKLHQRDCTFPEVTATLNQNSLEIQESYDEFISYEEDDKFHLPVDDTDNYFSKMERTASWIINHQPINSFDNLTHKNNTSVSEKPSTSQDESKLSEGIEEMEWTNAEPDDEVIEPNIIESNKEENIDKEIIKNPDKVKHVCVVVDTNVFISGLSKIRDIVNLKTAGLYQPIVYVPWMVITELDYMKDSRSNSKLSSSISSAIKFINGALKDENSRVKGQTIYEVEKQKHIGTSPDDKIIACCLQVSEEYENVILLSNDMNLKNKAMINNVTACSSNEIMMKLMSKFGKNIKMKKIMHKMGVMCSSVICDCMKETYGSVWLKMDLMSSPPWSLADCLKRFKKYWVAVFREKLMKQFTKTIEILREMVEVNKYIEDDSEEFTEFMKQCVTLCIFLKDIEECRGFVENTLNAITKVA